MIVSTTWTIALWFKQAARDAGRGDGGGRGLVRDGERDLEALFGFVKVNQATHSVGVMCRLLRVSRS